VNATLVAKMNRTVDECLDHCLRSSTPGHLTLEGFCRDLREDQGWKDEEIELLRSIVLRILAGK
jgi:hypothetical protein